jgi:putative membrane protein
MSDFLQPDFDAGAFSASGLAFLVAFLVAGLFTVAFKMIYQAATPYNERTLIRAGNNAAAITLGGALVGYVMPLASALAHSANIAEFAAWATLAGVLQITAFTVVRMVVMPDLSARIERGEIAAALYMMSISLSVGVLNAFCMTD